MNPVKESHLERTAHEPRDASLRSVVLAESILVGHHVRLFRLQILTNEPDLKFAPGQWVDTFCPGIPKAGGFTITSAPSRATTRWWTQRLSNRDDDNDDDANVGTDASPWLRYIELAVKRAPENPAAAWLWGEGKGEDSRPPLGQTLHVRVGGSFSWPPRDEEEEDTSAATSRRRYVFVASGVGINPIMSMVSALAEAKADADDEDAADSDRHLRQQPLVHVLYSARQEQADHGILFLPRLVALFGRGAVCGRLQLFLTGSGDDEDGHPDQHDGGGVPCVHRRISTADLAAAVRGDGLDAAKAADRVYVYVCGVPAMTDAFVAYLTAPPIAPGGGLELPLQRVLFEKWW